MRVEQSIAIGELSRRTGVNIETIRYFERVVPTPSRTRRAAGGGYMGPSVRALGFIRRARQLGFTPPRCGDPITWRRAKRGRDQ
jgi:MerR family mercuric resistance operon transcriptional regulator